MGLGPPFYDIIAYLNAEPKRANNHLVCLKMDCRQQSDARVTEVAEIFVGRNRSYAPLLVQLREDRELSPWLKIFYWDTPEQLASIVDRQLEKVLRDAARARARGRPPGGSRTCRRRAGSRGRSVP
jgi:hypothetical protein